MSRREDAALHVILTAAVVALLHEYGGDRDVVVGQPPPAAGDAEPLAEVLPLRLPVAPETSFRALLLGLRDVVRDALLHHDHPLDLASTPVRVVVALEGLHAPVAVAALDAQTVLLFRRERGGLVLDVRLDPAHFTAASAARIGRHCLGLLEQATTGPDRPLAAIDLRDEADRALVRAVNDTERPFSDAATLPELFARTVRAAPHAPAVIAGETTLSFAELDARVNRLAAVLSASGTRPGTIVGVLAERSLELLVGVLAIVQAGGAYLPLDPGLPRDRLAFMLRDSGASWSSPNHRPWLRRSGSRRRSGPSMPGSTTAAARDTPGRPDRRRPTSSTPPAPPGGPRASSSTHRGVVNRLDVDAGALPLARRRRGAAEDAVQLRRLGVGAVLAADRRRAPGRSPAPGGHRDAGLPARPDRRERRHRRCTSCRRCSTRSSPRAARRRAAARPARASFCSGEALPVPTSAARSPRCRGAQLHNLYGPTEAAVDVSLTHRRAPAARRRCRSAGRSHNTAPARARRAAAPACPSACPASCTSAASGSRAAT